MTARLTARTRPHLGKIVSALLLCAGLAWAGGVTEVLSEVRKPSDKGVPTFTADLSDLAGTDSTTWGAAALTGRVIVMAGDPMLEVVCRHSVSGTTACVAVGRRDRDGGYQGIADVQTSTAYGGAHMAYDGTGYYGAPLYFPLNGYYAAEVRVMDVAGTATVSVKAASVGLAARAAE